jgi:arylsulfatase A-like enzyme
MVWKSTGSFYDEVARVPLIVSWPGRIAPARVDVAANVTDVMPTVLGLLGHKIPKHVQGHNLAPYLLGKRPLSAAPKYTFCERVRANREHTRQVAPGTPGNFMIRGRDWKYWRHANGSEVLFNLAKDPGETKNLANDPAHLETKNGLRRELDDWLRRTGYPLADE